MALPVTSERREEKSQRPHGAGRLGAPRGAGGTVLLAALYPAALVVTIAAFPIIGERWWVTDRRAVSATHRVRAAAAGPPSGALGHGLAAPRLGRCSACPCPLLLILMGFVLPWPVWADANAPAVRVMSYNVNSEIGGEDAVVQEIDGFSPDIALLEEHGGSDKIVSLLQARYAAVHVSGQFIVASRFPITSTLDPEKIPYNGRLRSPRWVEAVIATPLGSITFYEVHPLSPREGLRLGARQRHQARDPGGDRVL